MIAKSPSSKFPEFANRLCDSVIIELVSLKPVDELQHLSIPSGSGFGEHASTEIDEIDVPTIPDVVRRRFVERLVSYGYSLEAINPNGTEYIHKNRKWSIQVAVYRQEIAFSVPYWDDAQNAIFEALQTAHEMADTGDLVVFDPQTETWNQ